VLFQVLKSPADQLWYLILPRMDSNHDKVIQSHFIDFSAIRFRGRMQQMQHYGQALVQGPTDFDDEVEKELAKHYPHEAGFRKMHAAMTGGGFERVSTAADQADRRT